DVLARMESTDKLPDFSVLQGRSYLATGKVGNLRGQPLFPGPKTFVANMNPPGDDDSNLSLVAGLFAGGSLTVGSGQRSRGLLLTEPLDLLAAADLLDRIRYTDHTPGRSGPEGERWRSAENIAQVGADPVAPMYRAPSGSGSMSLGDRSPYWLAAYLRFWHACLIRHVPSVLTTDEPATRWGLVDLATKAAQQPQFWVGVRFGDGSVLADGPLSTLPGPVRPMKRKEKEAVDNELQATWGSRGRGPNGEIQGDDLFDYTAHHEKPRTTPAGDRLPGEDGLILFHPIERSPGSVTMTLGMSIPLGGPNQIRAITGGNVD
ncbi:MAG: hypothetical protein ACRDS9_12115, partial [Pseudonocardiaceae bacterium]